MGYKRESLFHLRAHRGDAEPGRESPPRTCREAGARRPPRVSGQRVPFLRRKRGGCACPAQWPPGSGRRGREGRAAPPKAANCGERRPFEVLRVQGNGGGLLSAPIQRCFICSEPRRPWVSPRKSVQWPLWSLYLTLRVLRISKFLLDRKKKQEASFCGPGKCRAG